MYLSYENWTLGELEYEYETLGVASECDGDLRQIDTVYE